MNNTTVGDLKRANYWLQTNTYNTLHRDHLAVTKEVVPKFSEFRPSTDSVTNRDLWVSRVLKVATLIAANAMVGYAVYRDPKIIKNVFTELGSSPWGIVFAFAECQPALFMALDPNRPQASAFKKIKDSFEERAAYKNPAWELLTSVGCQIGMFAFFKGIERLTRSWQKPWTLDFLLQNMISNTAATVVITIVVVPVVAWVAKRYFPVAPRAEESFEKVNARREIPAIRRTNSTMTLYKPVFGPELPEDQLPAVRKAEEAFDRVRFEEALPPVPAVRNTEIDFDRLPQRSRIPRSPSMEFKKF